jgi:NADH dehydrogenase FAD-containing subunit
MASPLRLVLLGGGHAMLPTLRHAGSWTESGVEVTLLDPQRWLYYSGMVPEYLGGVYAEEDIRVDLARLSRQAGANFVQEPATTLDPENRVVTTESGVEHPFDVLAVDVGGVNPAVPDGAVATKPIYRIRNLVPQVEQVLADPTASLRLVIVGGGAAGVEIALNLTGRFRGAGRLGDLDLTIVEQDAHLLPGFPEGMRAYATAHLRRRGVSIRCGTTVQSVNDGEGSAEVRMEHRRGDPAALRAEAVLWATGTVGPSFLRDSSLPTDDRGFLHVTPELRTPTHPRIFAAGDCATLLNANLDKVGVHAVKQGPDLKENLDRTLRHLHASGSPPRPDDLTAFRPYPLAPLVLSTGERRGLWTAGPLWAAHPWLLRLKHWIDRRWIRTYAPERWGSAPWHALLGAEAAVSCTEANGSPLTSTSTRTRPEA